MKDFSFHLKKKYLIRIRIYETELGQRLRKNKLKVVLSSINISAFPTIICASLSSIFIITYDWYFPSIINDMIHKPTYMYRIVSIYEDEGISH